MIKAAGWTALAMVLAPQCAWADGPSGQGDIAITIYANNQALVQDVRSISFNGGRQKIEFRNVSAQIRPETASLVATDSQVVEQNFDYDLLSPAKIMENAVGETVTLVRTNPANGAETRETAKILAANGGVVLQIGNRIEVLRDDGLPVRVIFDHVPENMRAEPTLSVTVDASPGTRPATLRYLTPGLGWRADYVALFDEAKGQIDVQGWITLTNNSGTTYTNAATLLVAGNPRLIGEVDRGRAPFSPEGDATMTEAGSESGTRQRLGDYYLYPLAERTTIANLQTKQVSFLDVHGAPATHGYEMRLGWLQTSDQPLSAATVYQFSTGSKAGLGDQLPAGIVRFYMRDAKGQAQFIGEHAIAHTPMGSRLSISTGDAFDVKIKPVLESRTREGSGHWRTAMRYTLTNALPKPVTVRLLQSGLWGDVKVIDESLKSTRPDADTAEWQVSVPANGKTDVTATFDSRW
ncbi:DUF4139 domain-containing protein [Novosphingobium sp. FSW06-99]|uniref:DUF4139 domain-containing protein n=1 Tax=Novosphingobium sp. FSW06-99 TaxID=1739113 RepID=UPI00076CD30A|nr:hypothetical protein AQZ49_18555 [Novosphingobium sp. FSW06-99]